MSKKKFKKNTKSNKHKIINYFTNKRQKKTWILMIKWYFQCECGKCVIPWDSSPCHSKEGEDGEWGKCTGLQDLMNSEIWMGEQNYKKS